MRLHAFQIFNFKSIIDSGVCKVPSDDNIMILAGQNESGKSAILEALDFFFNGADEDFERLQKRLDEEETEVYCSFKLSDEDRKYLVKQYEADKELSKYLGSLEFYYAWAGFSKGVYATNWVTTTFDNMPIIKFGNYSETILGTKEQLTDADYTKKVKNLVNKSLNEMIPILTLYNSEGDLLPSEIPINMITSDSAVLDLQEVFNVDLMKISNIKDPRTKSRAITTLHEKMTDDFNDSWSQKIPSLRESSKYSYQVQFESDKIRFMIAGQDGLPLYLEQKSKGFRWFSAFHLKLKAMMKRAEHKQDGIPRRQIIILIDEPGQNLHDSAQDDVMRIINETADIGIQIMYSTHNPRLIRDSKSKDIDFSRINLVENDPKKGTLLFSVSKYLAKKNIINTDALSPIRTAMGLSTIDDICNQERHNVIVEGISDYYYFKAFQILSNANPKLYFIPMVGASNVKALFSLFLGWGLNFKAVFDDDKEGRTMYKDIVKAFYNDDSTTSTGFLRKLKNGLCTEDIFSKKSFHKYVIGQEVPTNPKNNSDYAKDLAKGILAKQFYDSVRNDPSKFKLDAETSKSINELFKWLDS